MRISCSESNALFGFIVLFFMLWLHDTSTLQQQCCCEKKFPPSVGIGRSTSLYPCRQRQILMVAFFLLSPNPSEHVEVKSWHGVRNCMMPVSTVLHPPPVLVDSSVSVPILRVGPRTWYQVLRINTNDYFVAENRTPILVVHADMIVIVLSADLWPGGLVVGCHGGLSRRRVGISNAIHVCSTRRT